MKATIAPHPHAAPRPAEPATKDATLTLLVVVSFFSESRRALQLAAELAAPLGARLVLLHLAPQAGPLATSPLAATPAALHELRHDLQQLAAELPLPATVELRTDPLPIALAASAKQYGLALFVLGRPAAEQADFELGWAVLDELRAAHLPVLLVPETYGGPGQPQRLTIAADDEPFALPAGARAVRQLLGQLRVPQTTVVTTSFVQEDDLCTSALHHVRASGLLPATGPVPQVEGFYATHAEIGLLHAVAVTRADWLLLLTHPRGFLDNLVPHSVSRRVLRWSSVPVLVVPTKAARVRMRPAKQLQ